MAFNARPTLMPMVINAKTLNAIDLLIRQSEKWRRALNAIKRH